MIWLTAGCVRYSVLAALEKLPSRTTATKRLELEKIHCVSLQSPGSVAKGAIPVETAD